MGSTSRFSNKAKDICGNASGAVASRRLQHPAAGGPFVKLRGMTPAPRSWGPRQWLPERRLGLSGRVLDVTERADGRQLRDLLSPSIGFLTPEKVAAVACRYRNNEDWALYGWEDESGALTGCIGLERRSTREAKVRHLAVAPGARRQGVGSALIAAAIESTCVERLVAETDEDAVAFYERCGFGIAETTSRWDRQRFLCTLDLSPPHRDRFAIASPEGLASLRAPFSTRASGDALGASSPGSSPAQTPGSR